MTGELSVGVAVKAAPATVIRIVLLFVGFLLLLGGAERASAQEKCEQCKYLRCLESTVARKKATIKVYEGLHRFWENRHTDESGRPLKVRDLGKLAEPERTRIYEAMRDQFKDYTKMEDSRMKEVPAVEGCGYSETEDKEMTVETDIELCIISNLEESKQKQPCKELADLIAAHEASHVKTCKQRQQGTFWNDTIVNKTRPPVILTAAGKALDEIAGYQLEIDGLQPIISKLKKKCKPKRAYTSRVRRPGVSTPPRWQIIPQVPRG